MFCTGTSCFTSLLKVNELQIYLLVVFSERKHNHCLHFTCQWGVRASSWMSHWRASKTTSQWHLACFRKNARKAQHNRMNGTRYAIEYCFNRNNIFLLISQIPFNNTTDVMLTSQALTATAEGPFQDLGPLKGHNRQLLLPCTVKMTKIIRLFLRP